MLPCGVSRRYDSAPLGQVERTPQGGIRVPATLTRTGVFTYIEPDGTVRREYRSPEEVFSAQSIATLRGAPVTNQHPPGDRVDAVDWRQKAVGHAGEDIRRAADGRHLEGTLYVQDAAAIRAVESGERTEVSLGYDQDYVPEPGISPEGEAYDGRQTNIRHNHIALVRKGRAGSAKLRLDGNEDPEIANVRIKIGGREYEAGTPEAEAAIKALETRADTAETEVRATKLAQLRAIAKSRGVSVRKDADGSEVMTSVIQKVVPGLSIEGKSPEWIMGAFEAAIAMAIPDAEKPADPNADAKPPAPPPGAPPAMGAGAIRQDAVESRKAANRQDAEQAPADPPDVVARKKMIEAGASRKP